MLRIANFCVLKQNNIKQTTLTRLFVTTSVQCKTAQNAEKSSANSTENHSFVMNAFRGQLESRQVFPYPNILTQDQTETLQMLVDPVTKFFQEVNDAAKNDSKSKIEAKLLARLWKLGAFGLQVPQEFGGLGLTNTQYSRVVEIVGAYDLGVGITLAAHQSIGFKGVLLVGTPEHKAKYLPRVTSGEFAAFCLTEPSSGSDAGSIKSRAILSADGRHFILNGSKILIVNGGIANIMTVFARTPVTDTKTGKTVDKVTAFIVERSFGGVTSGPPENKMGIKASNTAKVYYEDVKIPVENVLGGLGNGVKVAMSILNNSRFGMAATMSGTMAACINKAVEFATQRKQFGLTIDSFGTTQEKIARMSILHYVTQSMAYMISENMDSGSKNFYLEAAISKCFASEAAWYVCDEAIQILGGMGYMKEAGLERVLQDLRIFRIIGGTNDILRLSIALTGIEYAKAHLKELQNAFKNPIVNLGLILEEGSKRVARSVSLSSVPSMDHLVTTDLASSATLLAKKVDAFGQTVEMVILKYGRNIINDQFILNRLANSAIDIYTSACVLSRASNAIKEGLSSASHEKLMAESWVLEATARIDLNLQAIASGKHLDNFTKWKIISKNVCYNGGVVQMNPLKFNFIIIFIFHFLISYLLPVISYY